MLTGIENRGKVYDFFISKIQNTKNIYFGYTNSFVLGVIPAIVRPENIRKNFSSLRASLQNIRGTNLIPLPFEVSIGSTTYSKKAIASAAAFDVRLRWSNLAILKAFA